MTEQQTPDREKKIAELRNRLEIANNLCENQIEIKPNINDDLRFLLSELDRAEKELELFDQRGETIERQLNIIEQLQEENRKLRERLKEEIVWQDECLKLEEQLQSAQQEIERLQEELNAYKPSAEVFYERLQRLVEERDKLIKLLDMIKDDADRFGELVGIDVSETSLEEKGKAFNRKIEKLQEERDKLIEGLRWYEDAVNYEYRTSYLDQDAPIIDDSGQRASDILKEIGMAVEPDRLHGARVKIAKARFSPERLADESAVYGIDCRSGRCEG